MTRGAGIADTPRLHTESESLLVEAAPRRRLLGGLFGTARSRLDPTRGRLGAAGGVLGADGGLFGPLVVLIRAADGGERQRQHSGHGHTHKLRHSAILLLRGSEPRVLWGNVPLDRHSSNRLRVVSAI